MLEGVRVERQTVAAQVAEELKARILAGDIRPGTALTEEALARSIRVARSTVREALAHLVSEGLVTRSASTRVLHVTRLTEDDVRDIYAARRVIELAAVDASPGAPPEAIEALRAAVEAYGRTVETGDRSRLVEADMRCHTAVVGLLGSRHLADLYAALLAKLRLAEALAEQPDEAPAIEARHRDFVARLESGDVLEAREQLCARLAAAEEELVGVVRAGG